MIYTRIGCVGAIGDINTIFGSNMFHTNMNEVVLFTILILGLVIPGQLSYRTTQLILNFHPKKITDIPNNLKGYLYGGFILPIICLLACVIGVLISNRILAVIILALPFSIVSVIIIDHFINYFKNRTVKRSTNDFNSKTIEIQTKEQAFTLKPSLWA